MIFNQERFNEKVVHLFLLMMKKYVINLIIIQYKIKLAIVIKNLLTIIMSIIYRDLKRRT